MTEKELAMVLKAAVEEAKRVRVEVFRRTDLALYNADLVAFDKIISDADKVEVEK